MTFRQKLLLWGCLSAVGCILSYLSIQQYLQQQSRLWAQQHAEPTLEFLVLRQALNEGASIATAQLAVRSFPERLAQDAWLTASDIEQVLNAELKVAVEAGEPLKRHYFRVKPKLSRLRQKLAAGERAVTTRITMEQTLAGMLSPGDFIDIVVAPSAGAAVVAGTDFGTHVAPLLGIEVLAIDQQLSSTGVAATATPSNDDNLDAYAETYAGNYAETITLRFTYGQALQFEQMRQHNFSVWLHGAAPLRSVSQALPAQRPRLHYLGEN